MTTRRAGVGRNSGLGVASGGLKSLGESRLQTSVASGDLLTGTNNRITSVTFTILFDQTVYMAGFASWNGSHYNRLVISSDGSALTIPNNGAGAVSSVDDGGNYSASIPLTPVPLTAGTYTYYLLLNAQGSSASVGLRDRWLLVLGRDAL